MYCKYFNYLGTLNDHLSIFDVMLQIQVFIFKSTKEIGAGWIRLSFLCLRVPITRITQCPLETFYSPFVLLLRVFRPPARALSVSKCFRGVKTCTSAHHPIVAVKSPSFENIFPSSGEHHNRSNDFKSQIHQHPGDFLSNLILLDSI